MSRKKIPFESYRKRKQERTHSADDIVQGFDESMQSPEIPAATQPQGTSFLPPVSKKPKLPDIDLTIEQGTAVEQPLPMAPPSLIPLTPPTASASNALGQMSNTSYVVNFLQCVKSVLQSPISSPSITTQEYPRSVANDNLVRTPIKTQRQQQQSSNIYHVAGAPLKSNPHQSSSLTSRTGISSIPRPSMDSSLPSLPSKAPSVRISPPNKRNSVGTHHNDIKRLPHASRPPGSLLADAYSPSGFYSSSPTKPKTSPSQRSYCDVAGGMRGNDHQRNLLDKKEAEPVVVIDEDEREHVQDNLRHQTRPSKASRELRKTPPEVSGQVAARKPSGVSFECQTGNGEPRKDVSLSIPPLHDLKVQSPRTKSSPLKLKKSQEAKRPDSKEKDDSRTMSTSVAAPVYISAGESTDNTGNQARHTVASSSVESDSDVFVMETTSRYFEPKEMNKRRRSETPPVTKEVWPSITATLPDDILMKIEPTQQRVINVKPRDKNSSQTNFVPRCKDCSPENNHSNLNNASKQHHNCFAKNQSSSGAASIQVESKSSKSTGRAKPRISQEALNTTPTLSKNEFSFIAGEKPATGREAKPSKKTSQAKKNDEVIFQAEEAPRGGKQYSMRSRDRCVRVVSGSSDDMHSCEDDDDFQSPPSRKRPTTNKDNRKSFYGVLLDVASDKSKKAVNKFNKSKASGKRGGPVLTVKGGTSTSRENVKEVWKEFNPKVGRIPKRRNALLSTDEDETTLDLNMVQIGRFISDGAFNLEIKSRELHFPFQCGKIIHRTKIELKHLTSWKMNLGEGPQFIAVEVDMAMTNKLRNGLVTKFHLNNDFFKQGSQDHSQRYIIFRLAGPIYPRDVANINEILSALNGETLTYCEVVKEMSSEEATEFLESAKPSEPARRDVRLITNTEMNELSLADRDTSDDATTSTGQSGRAPRKEQLGWVRRSTRQKRPPRPVYGTSLMAIEDSDSQEEEPHVQRRPKTPNVKLLTYKPQGSKVTLDIMSADVECLDPGEYLNDKIIDFYLNYLLYEKLSEEFRSRVHIFSTFFYTRLSNASMDNKASNCSTPEKIHSRVKTWTRRVDLFVKDYIILPVCDRAHWYVVIVCHPGRFDPSKVKPPQPKKTKPRKPKPRARSGKRTKLQKKRQTPKGVSTPNEDINQEEGGKEEEVSLSQQQEDDRLEIKEETEVMDMEANLLSLPAIAEVRGGVSMSIEAPHQVLNLDSTGDSELLQVGEHMEQGEGEGESPFSQLALADVVPETPPSSQESERNEGREEREKEGNRDDSVSPSTTVLYSQDTLNGSAAACNDGDFMTRGESACAGDDPVTRTPMDTEETQKQTATDLNSELAETATSDYLPLEAESITIHDGQEGEPLEDEVIGEAGESSGEEEGDVEEEGPATGVESVEVKQEPLEEEEMEPQKWPCIQILDSLGIKRPSTAKRIRNYLTMEWKSKKCDKEDEMSFEHLPLRYPAIPLQDNSSDCGIFVLQFIESLVGTIQEGLPPPSVAEEWASYEKTRAKRKELEQLITELQNRDKAS